MSTAITKSELILYADDAVLVVASSTSRELADAPRHDFNEISNWYISNTLTVNVKKAKLMLSGSKIMLSSFREFTLSAGEDQKRENDIPEHFDVFKSTMSQQHGYNTRNGYMPVISKPRTEWGRKKGL